MLIYPSFISCLFSLLSYFLSFSFSFFSPFFPLFFSLFGHPFSDREGGGQSPKETILLIEGWKMEGNEQIDEQRRKTSRWVCRVTGGTRKKLKSDIKEKGSTWKAESKSIILKIEEWKTITISAVWDYVWAWVHILACHRSMKQVISQRLLCRLT